MQNSSGRLQRWTSYLGNFNITYKKIEGHRNLAADRLSRIFEDATDEMKVEFQASSSTDTSDYILSTSITDNSNCEQRCWRSYNFIIEGHLNDADDAVHDGKSNKSSAMTYGSSDATEVNAIAST